MKTIQFLILCGALMISTTLYSQSIKLEKENLEPVQVSMAFKKVQGRKALKVVKDTTVKAVDEPTLVRIKDVEFKNGTIEVKVLSRLLPDAPQSARGFIGLAFRISDNYTQYESIYIRPKNGRADDQVRRNHAIQYYSYPDYKFDRLREIAPEKYESYADMALNEWITMKIVVRGQQAKLYLNDNKQPSLVVNDLKLGADEKGAIGLWVEVGTEGYFTDLKVTKQD